MIPTTTVPPSGARRVFPPHRIVNNPECKKDGAPSLFRQRDDLADARLVIPLGVVALLGVVHGRRPRRADAAVAPAAHLGRRQGRGAVRGEYVEGVGVVDVVLLSCDPGASVPPSRVRRGVGSRWVGR